VCGLKPRASEGLGYGLDTLTGEPITKRVRRPQNGKNDLPIGGMGSTVEQRKQYTIGP